MKSTLIALSLFLTATSLPALSYGQKQQSRTRPVVPFPHQKLDAPAGMVYVPGGTTIIKYSQQATDSNCIKKVSLSSFFIDKCEVTNQQYRQFVEWVVDSFIITKYMKDEDKYYRDAKVLDSASNSMNTVRRLNWSKINHKDIMDNNDIRAKIKDILDERGQIIRDSIKFSFSYLRANGTNPKVKVGTYASEVVRVYPDEEIWAKDITNAQTDILVENYFNSEPYDDYPVVGVTWKQARAFTYWRSLTGNAFNGFSGSNMNTFKLAFSLPSEAQWVYAAEQDLRAFNKLLNNSSASKATEDALAKKDSKADATDKKDDKIAVADESKGKKGKKGKKVAKDSTATVAKTPVVDVPADDTKTATTTDAAYDPNSSWTATTATTVDNSSSLIADTLAFYDPSIPDEKNLVPTDKNGLTANFKQDEGDYNNDGSAFTVPVMSYAPNSFGIYNMIGNVSEWTMDEYSPSTFAFVSDVNPVLLYDADSTDAAPMRRKVVRGGSFLSPAKALSPYNREYEIQEVAHCYIGFRCVMVAPEILGNTVATRKKGKKK